MNTESKSAKQKGKLSAFEPYALMVYDIAATFIAVFVASWGTQHWATIGGAAGACPAIFMLALVNVVVFWFFHMYSSLWRYASISEAGRIVAAVTVGSIIGDVIFNVVFGKGMSLREDVMAWAIVLIICGGGRFAIRAIYGSQLWRFKSNSDAHLPRTLIVGAGETGSLSIKRMLNGDPDMIGDRLPLSMMTPISKISVFTILRYAVRARIFPLSRVIVKPSRLLLPFRALRSRNVSVFMTCA